MNNDITQLTDRELAVRLELAISFKRQDRIDEISREVVRRGLFVHVVEPENPDGLDADFSDSESMP